MEKFQLVNFWILVLNLFTTAQSGTSEGNQPCGDSCPPHQSIIAPTMMKEG